MFDDLNARKAVEILGHYLAATDDRIPRAEAERRMFAKLGVVGFLADVRPLLTAEEADGFDDAMAMRAFARVFDGFIPHFPGEAWVKTPEMKERYKLA